MTARIAVGVVVTVLVLAVPGAIPLTGGWPIPGVPVALALAPAAPAQDAPAAPAAPPAAKRENKVSDAAKAAFEKMEKVAYSPVALGLKELSGTVEMALEGGEAGAAMAAMGEMNIAFKVDWKAGGELKVETAGGGGGGPMRMMGDNMKKMVAPLLRVGLGIMKPAEGEEWDADAVVENGKTVVTIINYKNGVETGRTVLTLDDRGLPESIKSTSKAATGAPGAARRGPGGPPGGEEGTVRYTWKKEGDRWLLEKMAMQGGPKTFEIVPIYTDAAGFKILTSWKAGGEGGMGGMSFGFKFKDLVVNGKPVDLSAAKPEPSEGGMGDMGGGK